MLRGAMDGNLSAFQLLFNPRLNKGTAFTEAERERHGIVGLLPDGVEDTGIQLERQRVQLARKPTALDKYIFLSELQDDDGRGYLRVSTAIAPTTGLDAKRALAFNWENRVGYLAIGELDGVPYLQLCENRPYDCLDAAEIDRLILEIGGTGDEMERRMSAGGDLL